MYTTFFSVNRNQAMELLVQNVQKLSSAIQSLLKATDTALLERHSKGDPHLWERVKEQKRHTKTFVSSVADRKKELEESGM